MFPLPNANKQCRKTPGAFLLPEPSRVHYSVWPAGASAYRRSWTSCGSWGGLSSDYLQRATLGNPPSLSPHDSSDCWVRHGTLGSRTRVPLLRWAPHANTTKAGPLQFQLGTSPGYFTFPSKWTLFLALHCTECHTLIHRPLMSHLCCWNFIFK